MVTRHILNGVTRGRNGLRKQHKQLQLNKVQAGSGWFLWKNRSKDASLLLPKEGIVNGKPVKQIPPLGEWEGDDYFICCVKSGEAFQVKTLPSPITEEVKPINESVKMEEKLILDQPNTVTTKGTVEHVVVDETKVKTKKLSENKKNAPAKDVLLNENPLAGIEIIRPT